MKKLGTIWLSSLLQKVLTLKPYSLSNGFRTKYSWKNASPSLRVLEFSTLILELIPHQPQMLILTPQKYYSPVECPQDL